MMTRVSHEPGVAAAPPRLVRAPDGPFLPSKEPAAWSCVVPTSEGHDPHDSQAFLAMRLISRVVRSTGEIEGGEGFFLGNQRFDISLLIGPHSLVFPPWCGQCQLVGEKPRDSLIAFHHIPGPS